MFPPPFIHYSCSRKWNFSTSELQSDVLAGVDESVRSGLNLVDIGGINICQNQVRNLAIVGTLKHDIRYRRTSAKNV